VILEHALQTTTQSSKIIARGGVIAFRTDTFYGLGADPFNASAVQRIKQLKGREEQKPILIVISDRKLLARFIDNPSATFNLLVEKFWPGPLTLIGTARVELPSDITAGTGTVGLRLPDDDEVRELVRACGGALTATSANPAHEPPSRTAQDVEDYFSKGIDLIVDGGPARTTQPSTIVDATHTEPRLIREGVIAWAAIRLATDLHG
jgi:L-threonylcarbamoyladenylate synthase